VEGSSHTQRLRTYLQLQPRATSPLSVPPRMEKTGEIHLLVTDSGRGFNVEDAMKGKGLGLTNMRERARLIHGTITIESKPMSGTTILLVRAPLGAAPLAGAA